MKKKQNGYFSPENISADRRSRCSRYALMFSVLVVLCVVVVNLIVNGLPSAVTQLDTSAQGLYSLSSQTDEVVSALDQSVTIYLVAPKGQEDDKITRVLSQYTALSDGILTEAVDPALSPSFLSKYTSDTVADNSLIIVSGDRFRVVQNSEIYLTNYDYYTGSTSQSFDCEGQITSAIRYVTAGTAEQIYALSGHGETEIPSEFVSSLNKEGLELQSLSLISAGAVPVDAACIVLNAPMSDLTEAEYTLLTKYLTNGGKMLLFTGVSSVGFERLNALLAGYGVAPAAGVVLEGNGNYCVPSYANYLLPILKSHEITDPLIDEQSLILVANAHGISLLEDVRSTVQVAQLVTTSTSSYAKTNGTSLSYADGDTLGPFNIAVAATESTASGGETCIVWVSSDTMLDFDNNEMVNGTNYDLILNAIGFMTDQTGGVSIRAKSMSSYSFSISAAKANLWSAVYVIALPLVVIGAGILVCIRRKKAK